MLIPVPLPLLEKPTLDWQPLSLQPREPGFLLAPFRMPSKGRREQDYSLT